MASPALAHLTQLLDSRKLAGTLARPADPARPRIATGVEPLSETLAGGWPQGQLSELVGPSSSGRTSVVMATLAAVTRAGGVVGYVDVADRLDPQGMAEAGVDLSRVLWVRGPQLSWQSGSMRLGQPDRVGRVAEEALVRGLRAWDLIVRAGGFAVVVLDVADVPARWIRSLPMATWLRMAHALEGRDTVGLVVAAQGVGRSAQGASVVLRAKGEWAGGSAQSRRLSGLSVSGPCSFALSATH